MFGLVFLCCSMSQQYTNSVLLTDLLVASSPNSMHTLSYGRICLLHHLPTVCTHCLMDGSACCIISQQYAHTVLWTDLLVASSPNSMHTLSHGRICLLHHLPTVCTHCLMDGSACCFMSQQYAHTVLWTDLLVASCPNSMHTLSHGRICLLLHLCLIDGSVCWIMSQQ